jgi:hypothetical protein
MLCCLYACSDDNFGVMLLSQRLAQLSSAAYLSVSSSRAQLVHLLLVSTIFSIQAFAAMVKVQPAGTPEHCRNLKYTYHSLRPEMYKHSIAAKPHCTAALRQIVHRGRKQSQSRAVL